MGSNATTDINQGGGGKKAGFPYMIGRDSWASIAIRGSSPLYGQCCNLQKMSTLKFTNKVNQNLPIGMNGGGTIKMH